MSRSILVSLVGAAALFAVAGAVAGTPAAPTPAPKAKNAAAADPDKMVCKTLIATGSRLGGERTCMTRAQWDDAGQKGRDALNETTLRADRANPTGH